MRRLRSTILAVLLCTGLALGWVAAGDAVAAADADAGAGLRLAFTDATGVPSDAPYFSVSNAYPGMPTQTETLTLTNLGGAPAGYDLTVTVDRGTGGPQLADVLIATVRLDGTVRYEGPLSDLAVSDAPPVQAGGATEYDVAISWPDGGPSDNQYQGAAAEFDFVVRSFAPRG